MKLSRRYNGKKEENAPHYDILNTIYGRNKTKMQIGGKLYGQLTDVHKQIFWEPSQQQ